MRLGFGPAVIASVTLQGISWLASFSRKHGRPNSTQKPTRPGFGLAAEPPSSAVFGRRHAARIARLTCRQAACRSGFGTRALAAQLNVWTVRPTRISQTHVTPARPCA
jgi:hypothetical protein